MNRNDQQNAGNAENNYVKQGQEVAIQDHITANSEMVHPNTSRDYMLGFEAGKREVADYIILLTQKQHQADLLRAHIKELDEISSVMARTPKHIQYYRKRKEQLQAELAKLENVK